MKIEAPLSVEINTILRSEHACFFLYKGYRFFFFSNGGKPSEGRHIHVRKDKNVAKYWRDPEPFLGSSWGMTANELHDLEQVVRENSQHFRRKWDEYFNR
jgi:hypothetical protein